MPNKPVIHLFPHTAPFPYDLQVPLREARGNAASTSLQASVQHTTLSPATSRSMGGDPYYGNKDIARICARFMEEVFEAPALKISPNVPLKHVELPYYIAKAIYSSMTVHPKTDIEPRTAFAALLILMRLKQHNNQLVAKGPVGSHGLFLTAFMMGYKLLNVPPYKLTLNDWVTIGQGLYTGAELETYERRMKNILGKEMHIDAQQLEKFKNDLKYKYGSEQISRTKYSKSSSESGTLVGIGGLSAEQRPATSVKGMTKPVTEPHHLRRTNSITSLNFVASPALSTISSTARNSSMGGVYYNGIPSADFDS